MNNRKPYRVLEHLLRELDDALAGMTEAEQAHLLAEIRAECWTRLLAMDEELRHRAELSATSPLRLLRELNEWRR